MDFHLHLTTGDVLSFESEVDLGEFLKGVRPKDLFHRPVLQFLGGVRTVSVNPQNVEWIEIDGGEPPRNANLTGIPIIKQLSAEAFKKRVSDEKADILDAVQKKQKDLSAFGMATFRSGHTMYCELHASLEREDDRTAASLKVFSSPAIMVEREGGGMMIVNPECIVVWQVVPGIKKSAFFTLPAKLKRTGRG